MRSSAGRIAFASVLLLGLDTATKATENASLGVDVGIGVSDNIGLVSTHPRSETIAETGLDFSLLRTNTRLDANVAGEFTYLDYLRHDYGSQLLGRFDGTGTFAIVPEALTWTLQDDYGQAQLDPFSPVTPVNLQNVNYLTTGPDLTLRLDPVDFVAMSARYERATYSVSPFDSNGVVGAIGFGRQLAAHVKASLNVRYERLKFEESVNPGINLTSVYGSYVAQFVRTSLTADLGATRLTGQPGLSTGALVHVDASRKISPWMSLSLSLAHQLTNPGDSFSNFRAGAVGTVNTAITAQPAGIGAAPTVQTAGAYTTNSIGGGWSLERHRTTIALIARYERDTYDLQRQLDNTRTGGDLSCERQFTRHLTAALHASYYRTSYLYTDFLSNDRLVGGMLRWRLGRDYNLMLRYDHMQRSAAGLGAGFHENRAFLTIGYRPPAWERK